MITRERVLEVIKEIYTGKTLKAIFRDASETQSFYGYLRENVDMVSLYDRAQEARAELLFDEIISISDEERDSQRARNRMDARKLYASKMRPHKYGDRIDLNVNQTVELGPALLEATKRRDALRLPCDIPKQVESEIVETIMNKSTSITGSKPDAIEITEQNQGEIDQGDICDPSSLFD